MPDTDKLSKELSTALDNLGLSKHPPSQEIKWSTNTTKYLSYREPTTRPQPTLNHGRSISNGGFRVDSTPMKQITRSSSASEYALKFNYGIMDPKPVEFLSPEVLSTEVPSPPPDTKELPRSLMMAMSGVGVHDAYDEALESGYFDLVVKKISWKVKFGIVLCVICVGVTLFWIHVEYWLLIPTGTGILGSEVDEEGWCPI